MSGAEGKSVTLIGCGASAVTLTAEAAHALHGAHLVIGAKRLLSALSLRAEQETEALTASEEILERIRSAGDKRVCVVFSGDTGFYSGASGLVSLLNDAHIPYRICPGISSVQMLAARLSVPWQDWRLCSAHGVACDPAGEMMHGKPVLFLTGNTQTPATLCRELTDAGLGDLRAVVGEDLGLAQERITDTTVRACADMRFSALSVLWVEAAPVPEADSYGLGDESFIRSDVPMTKAVVRAAVVSALRAAPGDCIWDIGAGTGSVSVALSHAVRHGSVYAVEYRDAALNLIAQNRKKLCAWNLRVVAGKAPEALMTLPVPDAVFIGGSGGSMKAILDMVFSKNADARVCVSAIALETLHAACEALEGYGLKADVTQIAVSRTKEAGTLHMMAANNPVFLVTAGKGCDT